MDAPSSDGPLLGGNAGEGVVRVSGTVRRPAHPWSSSIDALLTHFEWHGIEGAPRALGYDDDGRQILSYVEGYVDPDPVDLNTARIFEVGRLIRRLHDAAEDFQAPSGAVWNVLIAPDREDLICHHDLAPWNLVRTDDKLIFIDWDVAGPGSRLWDLGYAAHGFVPLSPLSGLGDVEAAQRLTALVDGYGLEGGERQDLVELIGPLVRSMFEFLRERGETGVQPWARLWIEGHGRTWLDDALYSEQRLRVWEDALE